MAVLFEGVDGTMGPGAMREYLRGLADDIVSGLDEQDPENSQELLSMFVSELFMSATQQTLKKERSRKQTAGIAAAKARGVRFGPKTKPLPENFDQAFAAWHSKEMGLRKAAELCGMPASSFYDAVRRRQAEAQGAEDG